MPLHWHLRKDGDEYRLPLPRLILSETKLLFPACRRRNRGVKVEQALRRGLSVLENPVKSDPIKDRAQRVLLEEADTRERDLTTSVIPPLTLSGQEELADESGSSMPVGIGKMSSKEADAERKLIASSELHDKEGL